MPLISSSQYVFESLSTESYRGKQDDICNVGSNHVWYVNGFGKIFHSRDGGKTWNLQLEKKGSFFRCIAFIDTLRGFTGTVGTDYFPNVTDTVPLYSTLDGGKTWLPVMYKGSLIKGLCAIDIVPEIINNHGEIGVRNHIYGVGRVGSPAGIMVSHDDGQTFSSWDMTPYCSMLFDVKMLNKNQGFACGATSSEMEKTNPCILHTENGGKSWKKVFQGKRPFETTWKISVPKNSDGSYSKTMYATLQSYNPDTTVSQQRIIKSKNGGKSWKEINLINDFIARPFGIGFMDEERGFVGTMNQGYFTSNGGKDWIKTELGRACNKIRISRIGSEKYIGYAVGVQVLKLIEEKSFDN
jgi:photosystem II stability/assembly factor-like uncharacterized protein